LNRIAFSPKPGVSRLRASRRFAAHLRSASPDGYGLNENL